MQHKMEHRIILSADSTCDLGKELKERYQVHFYPFHIILDGRDYQDNVDIQAQDIYQAWREQKQKEALELLEQNRHLQDQLKVALGREQSAREGYVLQVGELGGEGNPSSPSPKGLHCASVQAHPSSW